MTKTIEFVHPLFIIRDEPVGFRVSLQKNDDGLWSVCVKPSVELENIYFEKICRMFELDSFKADLEALIQKLNDRGNGKWALSYDLFFPWGENMSLSHVMSVVNAYAPRWHRIASLILDHDTGHGISQALVDTWHDCFDAEYRKRPGEPETSD
jgi:hypothetical protein